MKLSDVGADLDVPGLVTVRCSSPGCAWWFWIDPVDPRLPDGRDRKVTGKVNLPEHLEKRFRVVVTCDRCGETFALTTHEHEHGVTTEAGARALAWREATAKGWRGAIDGEHLCPAEPTA